MKKKELPKDSFDPCPKCKCVHWEATRQASTDTRVDGIINGYKCIKCGYLRKLTIELID